MPPSKGSASPVTTARRSIALPGWPAARGSPSTSTPRARTSCSAASRRRRPPRCGRRSRRSRTSRRTRAAMPRCWRASHASPTSRLGTSPSSGRSKQPRKPTNPSRGRGGLDHPAGGRPLQARVDGTDLSPRLLDPTVELLDTGVISALSRMSILRAARPSTIDANGSTVRSLMSCTERCSAHYRRPGRSACRRWGCGRRLSRRHRAARSPPCPRGRGTRQAKQKLEEVSGPHGRPSA